MFDRCRRSSAAGAPVKYTRDSKNLRGTFARSKILLAEKLTNGDLVTPTPGALAPGPDSRNDLITAYKAIRLISHDFSIWSDSMNDPAIGSWSQHSSLPSGSVQD